MNQQETQRKIEDLERRIKSLEESKNNSNNIDRDILSDTHSYNLIDKLKCRSLSFYTGNDDDPELEGTIVFKNDEKGFYTIVDGVVKRLLMHGFIETPSPTTLTIASGVITPTQGYHTVDTQAAAATDDLDTISAVIDGATILVLRAASSTRTVVLKDGTGNLNLNGDFSMDHSRDTITLIGTGSAWYELARSNNDT